MTQAPNDASRVSKRSPAVEFLAALFNNSDEEGGKVYLSSLPNQRDDPLEPIGERHVCPPSGEAVDKFIHRYDRPRRGLFVCVGTVADTKRTKNNIRESVCLHADVDFKALAEDEPTIRAALSKLPTPPSIVVRSGNGLHLYWLFREPIDTQQLLDRLETALRKLADVVGGDPAVCEVSRLMRLPGTHNTKKGDFREVVIERLDADVRYELEDLEDWLDAQRPVLTRQPMPTGKCRIGTGQIDAGPYTSEQTQNCGANAPFQIREQAENDNPFAAFARQTAEAFGYKPRLDVDGMLAAMGDGNIHNTQVRAAASMISTGQPPEEVVQILMEATRKVAGPDWDWRVEEKTYVRPAVDSAIRKYSPGLIVSREAERPPPGDARGDDNVVELGEAKTKRKPRIKATAVHIVLAEAVLAAMQQQRGEALMFNNAIDCRYTKGLWRLEDRNELISELNSNLEEGAQGLKMETTNRLINEARNYILRLPELQRRDVEFDRHGCIPTRSGLVDPLTGEITPPDPSQYATWRIECDYNPTAACPWWLQMLEDVFADRTPEVRALYIQLLQEILGAGLIDVKPKAISKAVIFVGGTDYGKSGLIDVMAGLFGKRRNATSFEALERPHGTVPFVHRVPWVLHEAFNAGKWHLSSTVKEIISGEGVQVNIKGGKIFWQEVTVPIFWGSNTPPQFKEATEAIINRIVVIECRRKFDASNPVGVALETRRRNFEKPQHLVLATEMEGLLAWAVEGLKRVKARGYFILPDDARVAAENVRIDSNLVAGFIRDCIEFDPDKIISTPDFGAAFASWWLENKEGSAIPRAEKIGWALKAFGDPRIAVDRDELRLNRRRYYAGIRLNAEGMRHWKNTVSSNAFVFQGRTANTSDPADGPAKFLPLDWEGIPVIQAMRAAFEKIRDRSQDPSARTDTPKKDGHEDIPF